MGFTVVGLGLFGLVAFYCLMTINLVDDDGVPLELFEMMQGTLSVMIADLPC
jgi:hypothetical protein